MLPGWTCHCRRMEKRQEWAIRAFAGCPWASVPQMSDVKRDRWERATSTPLLVGAGLFLGAYAWPILQPGLPHGADLTCRLVSLTVWVTFGIDLTVRIALAEHRIRFLRTNWLDVVTLALPFLRPLRALRVVLALNMIGRRGGGFARGRVVATVVGTVGVVGVVAALAVLDAERGKPGANIETFGDALWWAATTITTVGYGDRFPTTGQGRLIAVGLMGTGIALLGVVTAALASWFVEKLAEVRSAEQTTEQTVTDLASEIRALREELQSLRLSRPGQGPPAT
jgi:voltage-gated potassium channel